MRAVVGACLLAMLVGCGSDEKVTGVRIVAQYGPEARFDQFELRLDLDGGRSEPILLPKTPGALRASPQDVVVYVPDAWAGMLAFCRANGLRQGQPPVIGLSDPVTVVLHQVVPCTVVIENRVSGPPGDGAPPVGGDAGVGDGGAAADAPILPDGGVAADANPPDAPLPGDPPPPGVDVPPPPDATPPDAPALTPDTKAPSDLAVGPPPPDTAAPVQTGCAGNAARTAFVDPALFPSAAGCGSPTGYSQAIGAAAAACASGWHWCKAEEVNALSGAPATVGGSTCGWVDGTQGTCNDRRSAHGQARCAGGATMTLSVGGPTSAALPCTGVDLGCNEPWKLAVSFDRWGTTSVTSPSGCLDHLAFQCTSSAGGASCWITCCKNP
jgi:hypothetical protein